MLHHFRPAGGAGSEQNPFGRVSGGPVPCRGHNLGSACDMRPDGVMLWSQIHPIGNDRIHIRRGNYETQMLDRQIGGPKNQAPRDAIQLQERQCSRELIRSGNQNRFSAKFPGAAAQTGAPC